MLAVTVPDEDRSRLAAEYLRGRMLEEALAAWQSDHARQPYWKRSQMLTRQGSVIQRLGAEMEMEIEAEAKDEAAFGSASKRITKAKPAS